MSIKKPLYYFPGPTGRIAHRKLERYDISFKRPYFETWDEAYEYLIVQAWNMLVAARREHRRAEKRFAKLSREKLERKAREST